MKQKYILLIIFFLAFFLRFWDLGANPGSLDWDEASLGYNAYSILKTGRDEYGTFLPLAIRSFNDFKPPLYSYLTIIPVALFGLTEFSTRFTSAFFGSFAVIIGYFLIKELFPHKKASFYNLFTFFFTVSPWHIQFSRIAFESNLSQFFFLGGILTFLKGLKNGVWFIASSVFFGLSMYAYHSPRLVVPLLLFSFVLLYFREVWKNLKLFLFASVLFIVFLIPLLLQLKSSTGMRLGSVTVMNADERLGTSIRETDLDSVRNDFFGKLTHNRRIVFGREILAGYLDHFNFDFLFLYGDSPGRHHAVGMGMLYFWDIAFVIIGLYIMLTREGKNKYAVLLWFFLSPVASAITTGTPHAVRSLLLLPSYQLFITFGFYFLYQRYKSHKTLCMGVIVLFLINFFYYMRMYWIHTPIDYASWWQYGYKQVVLEVKKIEDKYNKVIITYRYDQPYVYFLFYDQIDPAWYQSQWNGLEIMRSSRSFGKYDFRYIDWEKDSLLQNTIVVGTGEEIPLHVSGYVKDIVYPDGSVAFRITAR